MKRLHDTLGSGPPCRRRRQILIVEDHPVMLAGLCALIDQEPDLTVCGTTAIPDHALAMMEARSPDLVLVDIRLGERSGLELVSKIKGRREQMKVLVLSMHEEPTYVQLALGAGASGYIMKKDASEQVIDAIRTTLREGALLGRPQSGTH